jgi:hypothetical protein
MPVGTAFKVLVSAGVVAVPLATALLGREADGDPWWVFVSLPVGFSFNFYWGFVNYVVATPLALLFILLAVRYAARPTFRRGVALLLFAHLMFVAHVLLFGVCGLIAAAIVMLRAPGLRAAMVRCVPLLLALPVCVAWLLHTRSTDAMTREATVWAHRWSRLLELLSLPLGLPPTLVAMVSTALLVALPFVLGARPSRKLYRWVPLATVVVLFLFAPYKLLGTTLLYGRVAVFVLPTLLFALDRRPAASYPAWRQALAPLLAGAWIASLALRFWGFNMEVERFDAVVAAVPDDRRVLYFAFDRGSEFVPYPVFVYFATWYQVDRGGMVDFSFAEFFPVRFRYPAGGRPPLPALFRWQPWSFSWQHHGGALYDYYLVRSPMDLGSAIFAGARDPIALEGRLGRWWLYRRVPREERLPGAAGTR